MDSRAEEEIILLSAGTSARRKAMRGRAQQLVAMVDWVRLVEMLRARRLLPTLGPRILALAGDHATSNFTLAVEQEIATGCRQDALLQLVSKRIMAALADAGISVSALKGPLLGEAIYGEPGRRPSRDIDLLVSTEQLSTAVEIVRQFGYRSP